MIKIQIFYIYSLAQMNHVKNKIKITCYGRVWMLLIEGENQGCSSTGWEGCDWQSLLLSSKNSNTLTLGLPLRK